MLASSIQSKGEDSHRGTVIESRADESRPSSDASACEWGAVAERVASSPTRSSKHASAMSDRYNTATKSRWSDGQTLEGAAHVAVDPEADGCSRVISGSENEKAGCGV